MELTAYACGVSGDLSPSTILSVLISHLSSDVELLFDYNLAGVMGLIFNVRNS